ncbi:hypothetical protein FBY10_109179 [Pseudomonas sp. SJZ103]|nr:hypothetical protein FBY10_109179 [Pseudomonas sp. SJZ103]TWC82991.1 hypothetical protein FBY08_110163 [Pseudomonas sp. SJZ094]
MIIKAPDAPPVGDCTAPWIASKVYAVVGDTRATVGVAVSDGRGGVPCP